MVDNLDVIESKVGVGIERAIIFAAQTINRARFIFYSAILYSHGYI